MSFSSCRVHMGSVQKCGSWLLACMLTTLVSGAAGAQDSAGLVGVYVGEQPGAYLQNQMSSSSAYMFSAYSVNSDYWVSADIKYYFGDYADSIYVNGGITYAREQGLPAETVYRAGGGWETKTEGNVVYGASATVWWNETWPEPLIRGGVYIAYFR